MIVGCAMEKFRYTAWRSGAGKFPGYKSQEVIREKDNILIIGIFFIMRNER